MNLKLAALAVASAIALGVPLAAAPLKVGVAATSAPPFFSLDASGRWSGLEIDLMNAICNDQKLKCVVVPVAWDGLIPALTSGQIDMIMASMSITPARRQVIDFSDGYDNVPDAIVGPKGFREDASPGGLAGKIIGVQISTVHQAYARKYYARSRIKVYHTQDEANQDLAAGRIDATLSDLAALKYFLKSPAGACCELKGKVAPDPGIFGPGVGVGLRKGDGGLKARINAGIRNIRANGIYAKIHARYF